MNCSICDWFAFALVVGGSVSLISYLIFFFLDNFIYSEQDLKKKYKAEWAVVTGASSGIGLEIVKKLLKQGINTVMIAVPNEMLDNNHAQLQKEYPNLKVRKVGVNLGEVGGKYMDAIKKETQDILPTLIFNNAGYVATGLFADNSIESIMNNYECNSVAPVYITHHFANQIINAGKKGAIFFTSSPAGMLPGPTAAMYGSTKSFLTEFACSISGELKPDGIDVCVLHPSPVNTHFYQGNKHNQSAMAFFQKTATSPERIASCFFRSIGRNVVCDQGYFCVMAKVILKLIDYNALAMIITHTTHSNGDYIKAKKVRNIKKSN